MREQRAEAPERPVRCSAGLRQRVSLHRQEHPGAAAVRGQREPLS